MVDRVQVIKQESAALGGNAADELPFDAPLDPEEDGLEARRYYVQFPGSRVETAYVDRDASGNILLVDAISGSQTLAALLGGGFDVNTIITDLSGEVVIDNAGNVLVGL